MGKKHNIGKIEIREPTLVTGKDALDEIILDSGAFYFHLEQMDSGAWWFALGDGEKEIHVNLVLAGTRSRTARIAGSWYENS